MQYLYNNNSTFNNYKINHIGITTYNFSYFKQYIYLLAAAKRFYFKLNIKYVLLVETAQDGHYKCCTGLFTLCLVIS